MASDASSKTSLTLLDRLRRDPADKEAWQKFERRYGPKIYQWCLKRGLQHSDAEDVTQNVLLNLIKRMKTFTYDPEKSFRGWLKTLTNHAVQDFAAARKKAGVGSGDSRIWELLETAEARADLSQRLEKEYDLELVEEAMRRTQQRVQPQTWEIFRLLTEDNLSAAETAARLQIPILKVYQVKSRLQKMLENELRKLDDAPREEREVEP
jgi:RNA polymerase sigma-70 factor (ECF subfamily)